VKSEFLAKISTSRKFKGEDIFFSSRKIALDMRLKKHPRIPSFFNLSSIVENWGDLLQKFAEKSRHSGADFEDCTKAIFSVHFCPYHAIIRRKIFSKVPELV
jgi:hypothetical protein